jgi:hypothetical protein
VANIQRTQSESRSNDHRPLVAELCRMLWLVFGPAGLFFTAAGIWKTPPWTYSYLDGVFWGLALATVVARFVDVRVFHGMTTEDKSATMADFWRYSAKLVVFAAGIWVLAQSFQS